MMENKKMIRNKLNSFGDEMPDGRLTVHSNKVYRLHEAIAYKEEVGRTLTAKEMAQFELSQKENGGNHLTR